MNITAIMRMCREGQSLLAGDCCMLIRANLIYDGKCLCVHDGR